MTHIRAFLLAAACLLPTLGLADTVTLNPVADAYVQNGSNANRNYGTNTQLRAQTSSTAASNYDSYLRFDTATGTVTSAKLRLYASLSRAGNVSSSVHAVADTGWGETTITWNNKPALGSVLGSLSTTSTSYAWKEIDVTAYVQAEKAAGRNLISLGLHNAATSSVYVRASSRNATSNKPELVIVSETPPPPPPPVAAGVYYIYADHLNTPRVITDGTNKVVWRWDSDPFGADAANEDPDGDGAKFRYNLRFPGQYYDRETGLHYNYFRDYDPSTGRYPQADPIGIAGGLNLYAYVGGNPVSKIDPTGLLEDFTLALNKQPTTTLKCECGEEYSVFSGLNSAVNDPGQVANMDIGPIPKGRYYIVDRQTGGAMGWLRDSVRAALGNDPTKWFALVPIDGNTDDCTVVNGIVRCGFRLHPGRRSQGCITFSKGNEFLKLRDLLEKTTKGVIPGTNRSYYGTVTVQ